MKVLLDTRALLWWLGGDRRLGAEARGIIESRDNQILLSVVSLWEIVVKTRVGKLRVDLDEVTREATAGGLIRLDIQQAHLTALAGLPLHHGDPFDHLLVAQAIAEDADFMTADRLVGHYAVRTLPCR
ncbi:twitching motility protein PilT [alpha proteobacterium AAP81b]|nr:twitching motility protein PilT [alpha proteobacterium AAP81b]